MQWPAAEASGGFALGVRAQMNAEAGRRSVEGLKLAALH